MHTGLSGAFLPTQSGDAGFGRSRIVRCAEEGIGASGYSQEKAQYDTQGLGLDAHIKVKRPPCARRASEDHILQTGFSLHSVLQACSRSLSTWRRLRARRWRRILRACWTPSPRPRASTASISSASRTPSPPSPASSPALPTSPSKWVP